MQPPPTRASHSRAGPALHNSVTPAAAFWKFRTPLIPNSRHTYPGFPAFHIPYYYYWSELLKTSSLEALFRSLSRTHTNPLTLPP